MRQNKLIKLTDEELVAEVKFELKELVKETKAYSIFEWQLIPNQELISSLLYFGNDLTLLKPTSLKKEIQQRLIKSVGNYKKLI